MCSKLDSIEHNQWGKQRHDDILSFRNLEKQCFTAWQSSINFNTNISDSLGLNLSVDSYLYWWKLNRQSISLCLGWSLALYFHISPDSTQTPTLGACRYQCCIGSRERLMTTLYLSTGLCGMPHKQETQSLSWENFCDHIIPNIWPSNSWDCCLFDYCVWGAVDQKALKIPDSIKD